MKSFNETWESIHQEKEWGKYPSESIIRFIARNFKKDKIETYKALDFCCGAGANTWYLCREGFDVYAFDGSKTAVERTKAYLKENNLSAKLKVADALELDYEENFFDVVIDSASICCIPKQLKKDAYSEIHRLLKKDGKMISTFFTDKTTRTLANGTTFMSADEIKDLLSECGFNNVSIEVLSYTDQGSLVEMLIVCAQK